MWTKARAGDTVAGSLASGDSSSSIIVHSPSITAGRGSGNVGLAHRRALAAPAPGVQRLPPRLLHTGVGTPCAPGDRRSERRRGHLGVAPRARRRSVPVRLYGAVTLALGLFVAMMQAIHEQNDERRRLISQLETTPGSWPSRAKGGASPSASGSRARSTTHAGAGFASIITLYEAARADSRPRLEAALGRLEEVGRTARSSLAQAGEWSGRSVLKRSWRRRSRTRSTGSSATSVPRPASRPRAGSAERLAAWS
jgi:hypothetical protein